MGKDRTVLSKVKDAVPEEWRARSKVQQHPERVKIIYECCHENCEKFKHHYNYKRAYEVILLCKSCHVKEHMRKGVIYGPKKIKDKDRKGLKI